MEKTKRQIIISAAAILFREKGFAATTMRDLATKVGVKAASLYNHIKSKQDILEDLLMTIAHRFVNGMNGIERTALTPSQKIDQLISLHVKITTEETDAISLITHDWRYLEEPTLSKFLNMREDYEYRFKKILIEGIEQGELDEVHPDIALFSILSTMRWLYSWYTQNEEINPEKLKKQLKACLIDGLKK